MKKKKRFIQNFILFIILIGITFAIVFKDQDINSILEILSKVNKRYILIACISILGYIICEALNVKRNLKALEENVSIIKCIKYTMINIFFSGITPSSTGGQPMEVYYMHKDGVKISNGTLCVLVQSCSFQIITLSFAIISIFFNMKYMTISLWVLFGIGFILNSIILLIYLIAIFSKRLSDFAIKLIVKIMKKLRIKNIEEREEKLKKGLESYQDSSKYIKNNKNVVLKTLITTAFQIFFLYGVTYFVCQSFGMLEYNIFKIVSMQAIVYTSTSGIPLPGAVGISESNFIIMFKNIFSQDIATSAMLLSRGVSFYLIVIISGVIVIVNEISRKEKTIE